MPISPDVRSQLQTLAIPKDRRPSTATEGARRTSRKGLFLFCGLVIVLGSGAYVARNGLLSRVRSMVDADPGPANKMKFFQIRRQLPPPPAPILTATGKIVSDHHVSVATKVSGQIVGLHFEQGDRVQRGQILARIEDVLYRARRDQAAAELERAQSNLEYQRVNFDRVARLSEEARAAGIEYADAQRGLHEAQAQVAANQAQLEFAQKSLSDCEVVAPIAGVILERNVEVGDFVAAEGGRGANANAQFGTIADMSALRVEVDISELDIARVRKGMSCTITPDARKERHYPGEVMWIDPGANYSKATVQVKVRIRNPDEELRVEGSAQVAFLSEAPEQADSASSAPGLWIPVSACIFGPSRSTAEVFVLDSGRLRKAPISVGPERNGQVEVLAGLEEGQSIAAEDLAKLTDGQHISL